MRAVTNWRLAAAIAAAAAVAACASKSGVEEHGASAPMQGMFGGIAVNAPSQEASKVIVATFEFSAAGVTPRGALAALGAMRVPVTTETDFRLELADNAGRVLVGYGIGNPRRLVVENEGLREAATMTFAARFPFRPTARETRVLDPQGTVLARQDVVAAIRALCDSLPRDKDCAAVPR